MIDVKPINILAGHWIDSDYDSLVLPRLHHSGISNFNQNLLHLVHIYDNDYWSHLQDHHGHFACLDFRHWLYDDDIFRKYAERIASIEFPVISLFETPFGFEIPKNVPINIFVNKLSDRTKILVSAVKDKNPNTIILSPAIGLIPETLQSTCLDYFIHHRQYFDGYAVHCCHNMTEHTLGRNLVLLNQIMDVLPRKIWVTKWAVPTYDEKIFNSHAMTPSEWKPYETEAAIVRLKRSISLINAIAKSGAYWFYTGVGRDLYNPRLSPGKEYYWNLNLPVVVDDMDSGWDFWHFLGMTTFDGQIKNKFISLFIQLARQFNG